MLIAEDKKNIQINSGVINVYTFSHAYFEGVEFYVERRYVFLKSMEERKTYLSVMKRKKTMKCCQFQSYLCW